MITVVLSGHYCRRDRGFEGQYYPRTYRIRRNDLYRLGA